DRRRSCTRREDNAGHRNERSRLSLWRQVQDPVSRGASAAGHMRLYLDEDIASALLSKLLRHAGHDVKTPADSGLMGKDDPVQLVFAIREQRPILSLNYTDFENLHLLILEAQGRHPGILVVRRESDPRKNMSPRDIVRAARNLERAGIPLQNEY